MLIKVCGMRDAHNIKEVEALGIDMMGFIFWPKSKRFCAEKPMYLPEKCGRIGVFVNASADEIIEKCESYCLNRIQFHGDETPDFIANVRKLLRKRNEETAESVKDNKAETRMIKAISLKDEADIGKCKAYVGCADMFLFDTPSAGYGGTGRQFDWSLLAHYDLETPFLLSGGIGPDSIEALKSFRHPRCIGIDLNSKFETEPGIKDTEKLQKFIQQLKQQNHRNLCHLWFNKKIL